MRVLRKNTPAELFRMYRSKNIVTFESWMEALFFMESKTKLIRDDGSLVMHVTPVRGGETLVYSYQITETSTFWRYKNTLVKFYFDPEDMSKVYLFEKYTYKFIGEVKPTLVLTKANKDEILKSHRKSVRDINTYRMDQKKKDENIENGLPENYRISTPDLEAKILGAMVKDLRRKRKEKGEVDISNIKVQKD